MPNRPVVALDISVLLRLAGLDVLDGDLPLLGPFYQLAADIFRAVVDPDLSRQLPTVLELFERTNDPCRRQ